MTCLFDTGRIDLTPGALAALKEQGIESDELISRFRRGDWGQSSEELREDNEYAIRHDLGIAAVYKLTNNVEVFVITAEDRSSTLVLLSEEYERRELGTREGYAIWAETYTKEKNPLIAIEEPHVDGLLVDAAFNSALDVGTGTGRYALKLARRGAAVTALDQSPEMLAIARKAAQTEGVNVDFQLASLGDGLSFKAGCFDLLISALMLSHFPDLHLATREFHRVLRPGGNILLSMFHPVSINTVGWRTSFRQPGVTYLLPNMPHSREDYLKALEAAGFTILKVIDALIGELPEGYFSDGMVRKYADTPLALIIFARKPG